MPEYNEKMVLRYVLLKNPNLGSGRKWRHRVYPVSVYQLIIIFLMAKNTVTWQLPQYID